MCRWLAGNRKTCVLVGRMCRRLADSRKISQQGGTGCAAAYRFPLENYGRDCRMKKEAAIKIITDCAKSYQKNLENKNLLFVFGTPQSPKHFEASFLPRNFLHLTGVKLSPKRISGSTDFYERCLSGHLSPSDFDMAQNGTTDMKLSILPQLMQLSRCAKMVGDYDNTKSVLYTEKLAGNISACIGFVKEKDYYIPNTALREDIRDISIHPQKRVLAIFSKEISQELYDTLCYTAKKIGISCLFLSEDLRQKLAPQLLE